MGDVRSLEDVSPHITVIVETAGRLELANVGRFLQRLDTAARRATPPSVRRPRIEVVEITTGSLRIHLLVAAALAAVGSAIFDGGSFAVSVAEYLRNDPAASRSCRALIEGDNATVIIVQGGSKSIPIDLDDLMPEEMVAARGVANSAPADSHAAPQIIAGPHEGFVRRYDGRDLVELDDRPGILIDIRDERPGGAELLQPNLRYIFDGEAHIGGPRMKSYFVLRRATLLT
jgi:hypothetical protein